MHGVLLTLSTTHAPATDLGYLLHKHPSRAQSFGLSVGRAHVFYPEATPDRCTAALLVETDPIALVRGRGDNARGGFALGQYVNDRPYAASSLLAVAIKRVFATAMAGRCDARPELAAGSIPLQIDLSAVPCDGDIGLLHRLFGPLGWEVQATTTLLDPDRPDWGNAPYADLRLTGDLRLADALNQLYVLLPVLDDSKHYWVGDDEIDKLIRAGAGWLAEHPVRELIAGRYLKHQRTLTAIAVGRLSESDDCDSEVETGDSPHAPSPLSEVRRRTVLGIVRETAARRVADLGCGEGSLIAELLHDITIEHIIGADVSIRSLQIAARRLHLDTLPQTQRDRIELLQTALTYRDDRLTGLDLVVLMEVIEHVDPSRLAALERTVFGHAAASRVVVTTPNCEHNVRYEGLAAGTMRHHDHRFEWDRAQFGTWARAVGAEYDYDVQFRPVGENDPDVGPPTQLALFTRRTLVQDPEVAR